MPNWNQLHGPKLGISATLEPLSVPSWNPPLDVVPGCQLIAASLNAPLHVKAAFIHANRPSSLNAP